MGVDFSHCDAHWSYSGFNFFRTKIAKDIGIDLKSMIGYGGDTIWDTKLKKDPIYFLLWHSDCDGHITPKRCAKLAPRLKDIILKWDNSDFDKSRGVEFIKGLERASDANQNFVFH